MRISVLLVWLFAEAAFAASDGGSVGRMDFADTPAFHSVFESAARTSEAQSAPGVSAKVRIAMWASGSMLPARPESLMAVGPSALPSVQALQPSETITAKTVHSALLEENLPASQSANRKRFKRRVLVEPLEVEGDGSTFLDYQRRALSNRADLDDEESAGEDAQPFFLGQPEHTKHSRNRDDAQPSLLGRIFGALIPW